tara:strand:- start:1693 stop:2466 length:774 start_codon:yes stop_codon:yes gene_type:complete
MYIPRLKQKYQSEIINNLKVNYKSVMQVPKLVKICINQGIGSSSSDKKQIEAAQNEMTIIAGQKAVLTKSKKDISNFKLRKGMPVGVKVTLRGDRMYEFLDRLVTSTLPRVRDFNGIPSKGFDGRGNYTLGIKEQIAFPEISIDKINKVTGMDITFVTDSDSDKEALTLLTELGLPFKKNDNQEKQRDLEIQKKKEEKKSELEKQKAEHSDEQASDGNIENENNEQDSSDEKDNLVENQKDSNIDDSEVETSDKSEN